MSIDVYVQVSRGLFGDHPWRKTSRRFTTFMQACEYVQHDLAPAYKLAIVVQGRDYEGGDVVQQSNFNSHKPGALDPEWGSMIGA